MMAEVKKLEIRDPTGAFKNINDLLDELRNDNVEALAVIFSRKNDKSVRTFRNGYDRIVLTGILEQMKFDLMMAADEPEVYDYEKSLSDD